LTILENGDYVLPREAVFRSLALQGETMGSKQGSRIMARRQGTLHRQPSSHRLLAGRSWFVVAVGSLLFGLIARQSLAWDFDEHKAVCRVAYQHACATMKKKLPADSKDARWELACKPERQLDVLYGQACALAGDRVTSPEDLNSVLGGIRAANDVYYYVIALTNAEHFQPHSLRHWLNYHARAIDLAKQARALESAAQVLAFESMFFMSAFADHFLSDSFAAGHMGFNRMASSAGAAQAYHDWWNKYGRWLRSADGCEWFAKGDSRLKEITARSEGRGCKETAKDLREEAAGVPDPKDKNYPYNPETHARVNLEHVLKAENSAIQEVLEQFVFGPERIAASHTKDVWDSVPVAFSVIHKPKSTFWFASDEPEHADVPVSLDSYDPLMEGRMPAKYAYAWSLMPPKLQWQRPFSGTSELDAMAQIAIGPYRSDFPVIRGFYLDTFLGYGVDVKARDSPGSGRRQGPAGGFDVDLPLLRTAKGFLSADVVLGVQSLWWKRVGAFAGLRSNLYFSSFLLQLTAGISERFFDYEATDRLGNRIAIIGSISGGWIEGGYGRWGVPDARLVDE
jgi:hypothetical protein